MFAYTLLAVCVVAVGGADVVTQALASFPWYCMVADADPATGTVFVILDYCGFSAKNFFSPISTADDTLRFGDDLCLDAGAMQPGAELAFKECTGIAQQQWVFNRTRQRSGLVLGYSASADGPEVGQIMLKEMGASNGHTCMESVPSNNEFRPEIKNPETGRRLVMTSCNDTSPLQQWMVQPPSPGNKTMLFMPALRDVGPACLSLQDNDMGFADKVGYAGPADCAVDKSSNFWIRVGDVIQSAAISNACLTANIPNSTPPSIGVNFSTCTGSDYQRWAMDSSGALTLTARPNDGCLTWMHSEWGPNQYFVRQCTGDWDQVFAFGDAMNSNVTTVGPAVAIMNTGQCRDEPGWFDGLGFECLNYGMLSHYCEWYGMNGTRHNKTANTACCVCQENYYVGIRGRTFGNGAHLVLRSTYLPSLTQWRATWTWAGGQNGSIVLTDTKHKSFCIDARESKGTLSGQYLQLWECDGSRHQAFTYDRSSGTIVLASGGTDLCMKFVSFSEGSRIVLSQCDDSTTNWNVFVPGDADWPGVTRNVNVLDFGDEVV